MEDVRSSIRQISATFPSHCAMEGGVVLFQLAGMQARAAFSIWTTKVFLYLGAAISVRCRRHGAGPSGMLMPVSSLISDFTEFQKLRILGQDQKTCNMFPSSCSHLQHVGATLGKMA